MKILERFLATVIMISMLLVLLISSIEIAVYADYGYFEKEYEKYDVNNEYGIVYMDMEDLMTITEQMMSYLRGDRKDLVIYANIDGKVKEFFTEREKSHMADVRFLFIAALYVRIISISLSVLCLSSLFAIMYWKEMKKLLFRAYLWMVGILAVIVAGIGTWATIDFTGIFHKFHEIFFTNDKWLLDPRTSRLINILPEGFFVDTAIRIVVIFIMLILIMGVVLLMLKKVGSKRRVLEESNPQ